MQSLIPLDEAERIAAVRRYDVLDTPPDGAFDRLTAFAARHFGVPIAIVSIVDTDRIWFKSHHGVDVPQIGRDPGLCASAILQPGPWIVENAATDPRTLANPLVAGELGLRFYVGMPLTTSDGYNLGTFCIIDQEPRAITDEDLDVLRDLAGLVMDQLELQLAARRTVQRELELRQKAETMARRLQESLLPPELPTVPEAEVSVQYDPASGEVGGDFYDLFDSGPDTWTLVVGDVCGKGLDAASVTALARYTLRAAALQTDVPCEAVRLLNDALRRQRPDGERFVTVAYATVRMEGPRARVALCSGGHLPPIVRRVDGQTEPLHSEGMPLGLFDDPLVSEVEVELGPGDALVFYTDGITEARRGDEEFGSERLRAVIAEAGSSADQIAVRIRDAAAEFRDGPAHDDIMVLVLALPDGSA